MNTRTDPTRRITSTLVVLAAVALNGCALFVSSYDATNFEKLTSLKAYHLKFIDDFTEGQGKSFDRSALDKAADVGELKFREAEEYAQGRHDQTRVNGIQNLHGRFTAHCNALKRSHSLFHEEFSKELRAEIGENYDEAIKGEKVRPGAPGS
jgi:hypothetical protein